MWPIDAESLIDVQRELAQSPAEPWHRRGEPRIGGCWVCFPRGLTGPGSPGDVAWAAALVDATARDHPRGAGLALHLGAELGCPWAGYAWLGSELRVRSCVQCPSETK